MQYESEDVVLAVNLHEGVIRGWFVADRAFLRNIIYVHLNLSVPFSHVNSV